MKQVAVLSGAGSIGAGAQEVKLDNMIQEVDFNVWPKGELNTAFAKYFTGNSYLAALDAENGGPMNVTFEPRCRNNWHIHHKSVQVLVCVAGRGWYVEEGKQPVELRPGVVVAIPCRSEALARSNQGFMDAARHLHDKG